MSGGDALTVTVSFVPDGALTPGDIKALVAQAREGFDQPPPAPRCRF